MREQVDDRVADQADRRLVPGHDQEHDRAEDLLLGECVVLVPGGEQGADEIVLRIGAPRREQVGEVLDELAHQAEEALHRLRPERRA